MKTIILILILASTNVSAKQLTEDELMMVGACSILMLQQSYFNKNPKLGGEEFLKSFWENTAKLFGYSEDQFIFNCNQAVSIQIAKNNAERPIQPNG